MRKRNTHLRFLRSIGGNALTASRASVATLAIFAAREGRKNACWGASPNPALRDKMSQSKLSASLSLPLLFLILAPVRHAQQIVNVGLDRHGLPHFLLGGPVLGVQGLFLRRQLAALFF